MSIQTMQDLGLDPDKYEYWIPGMAVPREKTGWEYQFEGEWVESLNPIFGSLIYRRQNKTK